MPPQTLWTGNPNQVITVNQGNIAYDDPNTTYDQSTVYYDGTLPANTITNYTPSPVVWTQPNPL